MKRRRSARIEAELALHRFDREPPDAAACLEAAFAAFSGYRPRWDWCRQCFTPDEEAETRGAGDPRRAPLDSFSRIYFEHPNCSGGRDTFLHWLPRGLELAFLNVAHDYFPMEGAVRLGLWRWPSDEQAALRALFCRAALNWFAGNDPAPLRMALPRIDRGMEAYVSTCLVDALLDLRTDPFDLFAWLARVDSVRARDVLERCSERDRLIDDPSYYVLEDGADEPVQRAGADALDRLARDALHRVVGEKRLLCLWSWADAADPPLARAIEKSAATRAERALRSLPATRLADRALVAAATGPARPTTKA